MASSPEEMALSMLDNLPDRTGKTLDEWRKILGETGLEKHGQIVKHLKGEHGVTHGFANMIALKFLGSDEKVDLVAAQYGGAKAALLPIHDGVIFFVKTLGRDVEIAPKKTSVSVRRKKQFALITPATRTRVDLGLALKGEPAEGRLETYNAMCSHRVRLERPGDIDSQVKSWLTLAYSRAG
jgi:uncharacterized protein DUF4287/uncharacterized protein DUF5655